MPTNQLSKWNEQKDRECFVNRSFYNLLCIQRSLSDSSCRTTIQTVVWWQKILSCFKLLVLLLPNVYSKKSRNCSFIQRRMNYRAPWKSLTVKPDYLRLRAVKTTLGANLPSLVGDLWRRIEVCNFFHLNLLRVVLLLRSNYGHYFRNRGQSLFSHNWLLL